MPRSNRIVRRRLLEEFVERRRASKFAREMASMASDPSIRREAATINEEFVVADSDGLGEE